MKFSYNQAGSGRITSLILALMVVVMGSVSTLNAQIKFQNTYHNDDGMIANSVWLTHEGGYVITGWYNVDNVLNSEYYLLITDSAGNQEWSRTYGERIDLKAQKKHIGGNESFFAMQTKDSGYFVLGEVHGFGSGQSETLAVRLDAKGDTVWSRTFGSKADDFCNAAVENEDGGFTMAGLTESFNVRVRSVYMLRIDKNGDTLWTKTIGSSLADAALDIKHSHDGGYIFTGYASGYENEKADVFLVKMDTSGNLLWARVYGGDENDFGSSVELTDDGGYIIAGSTESFGDGQDDLYLIRTDSLGRMVWSKTYGGGKFESGASISKSKNGYMVTGNTNSFGWGKEDLYLLKVDNNGDTLWTKTYGGLDGDFGTDVKATPDGGSIITGYTSSFGNGILEIYLIKTDSLGNSNCNAHTTQTVITEPATMELKVNPRVRFGAELGQPATLVGNTITRTREDVCMRLSTYKNKEAPLFLVYPNPGSDLVTLEWKGNSSGKLIGVEWLDSRGQVIWSEKNLHSSYTKDIRELSSGWYSIRWQTDQGVYYIPFIKP